MRMGKHILLRTLRFHLKHRLNKREEQRFILRRVQSVDQEYCVTLYRKLWQLYVNLSSKYQIWPVSHQIIVETITCVSLSYRKVSVKESMD